MIDEVQDMMELYKCVLILLRVASVSSNFL